MDLASFFVQALNGLASASSLFLVAAGLSLIFGVTRIVNFAHGALYMVGAFLAGAVIESKWFNQSHMDFLRHHVLLVMMPVFFLSTGLRTNWSVGGATVFLAAGLLLLASVSGKLAGVHMAGKILKWQPGEASLIGWLLQTKALIMIIFANILLDKQIITSETFTALLLMAVLSTMLTTPMVTPMLQKMKHLLSRSH
jgi:Kef-type K+ transport system membrane component KefB